MSVTLLADRSDCELVQSLLAGERSAWRAFVQRYDRLICAAIDGVLARFPKLISPLDREDVRAALYFDLLAREMHKLRVFDFERNVRLGSWLRLLATRAARDHVRSALRRSTYVSSAALAIDAIEPDAASPLSRLLAKENVCQAMSEVERLSERDRQLLDLLLVQDQEPDAVAATMNISLTTVYTKKHKLVLRLRRVLTRASVRSPRRCSPASVRRVAAS